MKETSISTLHSLHQAYDADAFRKHGHQLIDILADYLQAANARKIEKAIPFQTPEQALHRWEKDMNTAGDRDPVEFLQQVLEEGVHLHHPRYMGHQISPPAPVAALAGLLNDFMNNGMGVYEMGIPATTLEYKVGELVARQMGFGDNSGGILTSGGTLANLTALLTARSVKASGRIWTEGNDKQLALMVSEEAHYCVDRAVRIMGWGEAGIIKVPADEHFRMRTDLLEDYLASAKKEGKEVIAVVGSACSTSTGSFDNLNAIADFCEKHSLWMHVDGAHGAATVFSEKYEHLVSGIHRADSIAMDFHKMLITPALATALVYKKLDHSYQTFAQKAQYLFNQEQEEEWFNLARRTFECTKAMYSIKFYSLWRTYGPQLFDEYVTKVVDLGRAFGEILQQQSDFTLATDPACNIVCFRYEPSPVSVEEGNSLNEHIRQQLLEDGRFYIVKTTLRGKLYLRVTLTNAFTQLDDLRELLEAIRTVAKK